MGNRSILPPSFKAFLLDEGGQAMVEYVLALAVSVAVIGAISRIFKKSIVGIWTMMRKEISGPCPDCINDQK